MKKTEQYQLNQWEMSDRIRMEDFNADNLRLESILEGKTGRFQRLEQYTPETGTNRAGVPFYRNDWGKWEIIMATWDVHETTFLADDYYTFGPIYESTGTDTVRNGPAEGSFFVLLFPFHDETAKVRGIILGTGGRAFFSDRPFKDLKGLTLYLKNTSSTHFMKDSTTTFVNPVWTVYGLK